MAEECPPSEVPIIKEDNAPMDCETSELQSIRADDSSSDKNVLTLPVSEATSAAASTPDSEGAIINLEDAGEKDVALALPVSGATSAAASTPDSESAMNPEEVQIKEGALTLPVTTNATSTSASDSESALLSPADLNVKTGALTLSVSGATTSASISDSGCATSPDVKGGALTPLPVSGAASSDVSGSEGVTSPDDKPAKEVADVDPPCPQEPGAEAAAPVSGVADVTQDILSPEKVAEMMSPDKEKVGIFKGVKTAIRTKVKQVWKKLSPKKPEKASLAASAAQDESNKEPEPAEKKPYKVVTYVSPTRTGSLLVLNSTASDEVTLDTDLPTSGSEVFLADEGASTATGESSTHASRLPSLGDDPSERSPEKDDPPESSTGPGDETTDDGNPEKSS